MSENKLLLTSFPITPQPAMAHSKPFVLLVDDEKRTLKLFAKNFSTFFPILTASSAEEGIDLMTKNEVAVLISDQRMPSKDGTMMLHYSSIHHPRTVKILTTAYEDYDILVNAVNEFSIFGFFTKPWDPTQIIKTVTNALDIYTGGRLSTSTSSIYSAHQHDRRIVVDPNHLQEIVSLISVFQSQTKNIFQNPGSCTIKQAGDDVIICSQDSSDPASTFSLSLKDLRKSIQLIHSIDPNSFMSEEAKPPLLPINREPKQNLSSHIVYSSVRLTQLGSYLRTVRVQAEQGVVTRIRPKTGHTAKFRQRILEIERKIGELESKEVPDARFIKEIALEVSDLLHSLNSAKSTERRALELSNIEPSTISTIFASYNTLATDLSFSVISPNPEILHPKKTIFSTETTFMSHFRPWRSFCSQ